MRIINKKQFCEMPIGTLFSHYEETGNFQCLKILTDSHIDNLGRPVVYWYQSLVGNIEWSGTDDFFKKIISAEKQESGLDLDFESVEKEHFNLEEEYFAVYEKKDIEGLISALQSLLT